MTPTIYRPPVVRALAQAAANRNHISIGSVFARSNEPPVVRARAEVMRELKRQEWSCSRIGRAFGMHHSTVMYHVGGLKKSKPEESLEITYPDLSGEWAI